MYRWSYCLLLLMGEGMKENLFSAAERHYPIEVPFKIDELFVMRMEIPRG